MKKLMEKGKKIVGITLLVIIVLAIISGLALATEDTPDVNKLPGWDCKTEPTVATVTSSMGNGALAITYPTKDGGYAIVTQSEVSIIDGAPFSSENCE